MEKIFNLFMAGVGGQGIILASDIITRAAMNANFDVKKSEIHGMSQRGGSVFSHIRFGNRVFSPVIPEGMADIFVSLEQMETLRWLHLVNSNTLLIVYNTKILPAEVKEYPQGIEEELKKKFKNLKIIDPEELIKKVGNQKFVNVALVGIISKYLSFDLKDWELAIEKEVPEGTFENNKNVFFIQISPLFIKGQTKIGVKLKYRQEQCSI